MGIWDDLSKTISSAASATAQKTKDIAGLSKLSLALNGKESDLKELYAEIGKTLYEEYKADAPAALAEKIEKADTIQEEMAEIRKKILVLKNIAVCPDCAAENELSAKFCTNCGAKLATPEPVIEAVPVEDESFFETVGDKVEEIADKIEDKLEAVFDKDDAAEDAVEAVQEEILDAEQKSE